MIEPDVFVERMAELADRFNRPLHEATQRTVLRAAEPRADDGRIHRRRGARLPQFELLAVAQGADRVHSPAPGSRARGVDRVRQDAGAGRTAPSRHMLVRSKIVEELGEPLLSHSVRSVRRAGSATSPPTTCRGRAANSSRLTKRQRSTPITRSQLEKRSGSHGNSGCSRSAPDDRLRTARLIREVDRTRANTWRRSARSESSAGSSISARCPTTTRRSRKRITKPGTCSNVADR
jgi:hypothetical protein